MELEKGNRVMMMRDYRKGNWTLEETMVLIEAKKLDEQRRMLKNNPNAQSTSSTMKPSSSGELRWKWIEEHCWKKGCLRSQNQCNDKWDNLMRDFKKIREYERRNNDNEDDTNKKSYWTMDKIERKNNNLPTNMLPQLYHALANVVESKFGSTVSVLPTIVFNPCTTTTNTTTTPLPPPPPPPPPLLLPPSPPPPSALPAQESSTKRKKPSDGERSISEEISTSSSLLIEAIKGFEEREERRHKELYDLHQKRYKLDESKIELERQGFDKLVDAINNLSNSIIAFTSQRTHL
uniref:trihelix transcription factor ASR3-like n=1 Tax=Erigeron canadensis TaxID=72917 RepID=UPI001CB9223D|nr:trihelix transcription factor ASR3-like [Erigeron canadensis]